MCERVIVLLFDALHFSGQPAHVGILLSLFIHISVRPTGSFRRQLWAPHQRGAGTRWLGCLPPALLRGTPRAEIEIEPSFTSLLKQYCTALSTLEHSFDVKHGIHTSRTSSTSILHFPLLPPDLGPPRTNHTREGVPQRSVVGRRHGEKYTFTCQQARQPEGDAFEEPSKHGEREWQRQPGLAAKNGRRG